MIKFRIIKNKQKIQEVSAKKVAGVAIGALKILADLGSMLGVNTQAISTITNFFKGAKEILKNAVARKFSADEEKVINALKQDGPGGRKLIKEFKKWGEGKQKQETDLSPEQIKLQSDLFGALIGPTYAYSGLSYSDAEKISKEVIKNNPTITDLMDLIRIAIKQK